MLVLERKKGQSIIINGNIEVWYSSLNAQTGKIKLAINAPKDIVVDRAEIHQRKLNGEVQKAHNN